VPSLPLRVGRHLRAWIVWHTSGVSVLDDGPPRRNRPAARI